MDIFVMNGNLMKLLRYASVLYLLYVAMYAFVFKQDKLAMSSCFYSNKPKAVGTICVSQM